MLSVRCKWSSFRYTNSGRTPCEVSPPLLFGIAAYFFTSHALMHRSFWDGSLVGKLRYEHTKRMIKKGGRTLGTASHWGQAALIRTPSTSAWVPSPCAWRCGFFRAPLPASEIDFDACLHPNGDRTPKTYIRDRSSRRWCHFRWYQSALERVAASLWVQRRLRTGALRNRCYYSRGT